MPYLKLATTSSINKNQTDELLSQFSQLLAKQTGKSEQYVMVQIEGDKAMSFAGNTEPLAYLECKSIGLSAAQAKSLSTTISRVVESQLQIKADRVYIEFSCCAADYWGWNGSTFG